MEAYVAARLDEKPAAVATAQPEVPYRGYTLKEITLVPAPEHLPLEFWQPIQSGSERAFDFSWPSAASAA